MITIGKYAGFCGGVTNSVTKTEKYLEKYKNLYCLGELVHNKQVINSLEDKGLKTIESLNEIEDNSTVIVRAHGVSSAIYEEAKRRNITLLDLTCPKVLDIHKRVSKYKEDGYYIIIVGSKDHPEVIGTISFCGDKSAVIEKLNDVEKIINTIKINNYKNVVIFAQTTIKETLFNDIVKVLKKDIDNLKIENTICNATHLRQQECLEMAKNNDSMIIIGGKNSSNTKKLYEVALSVCPNSYLIETSEELNYNEVKQFKNIGIMAGASTPKKSIDEVFYNLQNINNKL